jgi:Cu/Ag efflux pump CusA
VSFEGQFQSQQEATRLIALLSLFTLATMFLLLYSHFRSAMIVGQILLNIPLAFIGGVALTYVMVGTVSVATLVGLITLAGIASRNTIMMDLALPAPDGARGGALRPAHGRARVLERLVPVMMTALVAGLALFPLVLAAGEPGKEILYPVAVVILGCVLSSTLLDMAVTPAVFFRFGRRAAERYLAPESGDPLDAIPAVTATAAAPIESAG